MPLIPVAAMLRLNMSANKEFSPQSPILTKAKVIAQITEKTYKASLSNGKQVHIHTAHHPTPGRTYQNGEHVIIELKPYDFSRGRIKMQGSILNSH